MVKRKKEKPKENLHTRIEHLFELINGATIKSEPVSDSSLEIKIGEFEDLPDFETTIKYIDSTPVKSAISLLNKYLAFAYKLNHLSMISQLSRKMAEILEEPTIECKENIIESYNLFFLCCFKFRK